MNTTSVPPIRGLLIHMSHYDPVWFANKKNEKPFDLRVGLEVIDAMAQVRLNMLVIAFSDGVKYRRHPELARPYSAPMSTVRALVRRAAKHGIEVVPKLNFSQSGFHHHNEWFRPHHQLFDSPDYWRMGFEVIDEIIANVKPPRFFHIGMDEDHDRSYDQYVQAILTLHKGLAKRQLRTVIWNDSANLWPCGMIHAEKSMLAEKKLPKSVVQVVWDYAQTKPKVIGRVARKGFELWVAPSPNIPGMMMEARRMMKPVGAKGILLTRWQPMTQATRDGWLNMLASAGPLCSVEV
ncbi:MAG: hypothetical protein WD042_14990 [Phycisphaeraceae bacterium]